MLSGDVLGVSQATLYPLLALSGGFYLAIDAFKQALLFL